MRDTERERERQKHRQREKQAPLREPDVGLDPGSPGSHPGLQAVLNLRTTRAALETFLKIYLFIHSEKVKREAETQAEGEAGSMQGA